MSSMELNQLPVLTETTYAVGESWSNKKDMPEFTIPFAEQERSGQRFLGRGLGQHVAPQSTTDWYEHRAPNEADLSQLHEEMGGDETAYHKTFPKRTPAQKTTAEKFTSRALGASQFHDYNVYTTAKRATSPNLPELVETFTVAGKDISGAGAIGIVICVLIIVVGFIYLLRSRKSAPANTNTTETKFGGGVEEYMNNYSEPAPVVAVQAQPAQPVMNYSEPINDEPITSLTAINPFDEDNDPLSQYW